MASSHRAADDRLQATLASMGVELVNHGSTVTVDFVHGTCAAWLQWQRRLLVRWEYYAENFLGFVQLATIGILLRQF